MWAYDEENGRHKVLAYIGLVVLGIAFGYAIGAQTDKGPTVKQILDPGGVQTYSLLTHATEQARSEGDDKSATWLESQASAQRTRLLTWAANDRELRGGRR
jgi:hypothetical protein